MELHIEIIAPNGVQVKQIFSSIDVTEDEDGELEKLTKQVQAGGIISLITEDGALMLNTSKLVSLDAIQVPQATYNEDGEEDGMEEVYTVDIVMSV